MALSPQAKAGFFGPYNLANWTLTNSGDVSTDGFVGTPDLGLSIILTGGNGGSGFPGLTTFLIAAPAAGQVQFNWSYTSNDTTSPLCGGPCDTGGYMIGNVFTFLADDTTAPASGTSVTFTVSAGQLFGFAVQTADNQNEPGVLTISNFSAPAAVPEPGTAGFVLVAAAATIGFKRWKNARTGVPKASL